MDYYLHGREFLLKTDFGYEWMLFEFNYPVYGWMGELVNREGSC